MFKVVQELRGWFLLGAVWSRRDVAGCDDAYNEFRSSSKLIKDDLIDVCVE